MKTALRLLLGSALGLASVGLYSLVAGCACVDDPFVAIPLGAVIGAVAFYRVGES